MSLLAATPDALYRVDTTRRDRDAERVLDAGVRQVVADGGRAYAATADGLFVADDGGETWTAVDAPVADLHSVAVGDDLLVGSRPVAVHRRRDGEWTELAGLRDLAAREGWPTPAFRDEAWARSVATDVDRVVVGVEVGGVAVRDPDGTWRSVGPTEADSEATQRCDDVHQVAVRGPDDWLAATGDGVFHTLDAGHSWVRLDTGERRYVRACSAAGGTLVVGANDSPPRWRPPDAALLAGAPSALGSVPYPGEPERFAVSFALGDGGLYAGTNDGTILRVTADDVTTVASVPVSEEAATAYGVRSLAVV